MFVYTAKLTRKKLVLALAAAALLVAGILLLSLRGCSRQESGGFSAVVKTNRQRVAFLESLGWEVSPQPIDQQTVLIPRDFTQVYQDYNTLQLSQGFDLSPYGGMEAMRFTYEITNYPNQDGQVVADLLVVRNRVVAGDIQCTALDGFMQGLAFPADTMEPVTGDTIG